MTDKKQSPLISIILTTYNRRDLLPYAIQSILNQTYTNYEIIIVNDFGEDVWDIIESFGTDKIVYQSHIRNSGLSYARNTAINIAEGDILCYLDDDDLFLPNHLETSMKEFQKNDIDFVYANSYYVEEELKNGERIELERSVPYEEINFSMRRLLVSNFIPVNAWTHRSSLIKEIGYFDESLSSHEDWDMLIRLTQKSKNIVYTKKKTVEVRHRKNIEDNMLSREQRNFYCAYSYIYKKYLTSTLSILKERQVILYDFAKNEHKLWIFFKETILSPLQIIIFIGFRIGKIKDKFVSK